MKEKTINKFHILFFFLLILIFNLFYPYKGRIKMIEKGEIAETDIIAPYGFKIVKLDEQLREEKKEAAEKTVPVLQKIKLTNIEEKVDSIIDVYGDLTREGRIIRRQKDSLLEILSEIYRDGIISSPDNIPSSKSSKLEIQQDDSSYIIEKGRVRGEKQAKDFLVERAGNLLEGVPSGQDLIEEIKTYIKPNLLTDYSKTEKKRNEARTAVKDSIGFVRKGEKIVGAHEVVNEEEYQKLLSLKRKEAKLYTSTILPEIGKNQLYFILISIFIVAFLYFRLPKVFSRRKFHYLFLINFFLALLLYKFLPRYLFPLPSFIMFFTLAVNLEFGLLLAISSFFVISLYESFAVSQLIPVFLGALVGGVLLVDSKNREDWYKTGLVVGISISLLAVSMEILNKSGIIDISYGFGFGIINGFLSILILFALLFFFERIFNITTNFTWMEYSDLNHPLLKRLAKEAPGTYQHALMVSTLAENAGEAIEANPLLAKVGGLYHDIGKLRRPEFFAENFRTEKNPHDKLPPKLSAIIIKSHILDGIRMAKENKLPGEIIDIIKQHQGKSLIVPFYEKAKKYHDEIDEENFRYETDLPVTKEAGILMLADMVEATVRSMDNPSEKEVKEMIDGHINKIISRGQLRHSKLSIRDLEKISSAFAQTLEGLYHHRPKYPSESA